MNQTVRPAVEGGHVMGLRSLPVAHRRRAYGFLLVISDELMSYMS